MAVEAMRRVMGTVPIDGTIVIREGERDKAPMLFIGEIADHGEDSILNSNRGYDVRVTYEE